MDICIYIEQGSDLIFTDYTVYAAKIVFVKTYANIIW